MLGPVAVVLDSNQRSALAVTRSLGQRGIPVINGDTSRRTLAGVSRFSAGSFTYPDPRVDSEKFLSEIQSTIDKYSDVVLFPITDLTVSIVLRDRHKFAGVKIPFPKFEVFDSLTDKGELVSMADECGLNVPDGQLLTDPVVATDLGRRLGYPLVVKPVRSEFLCAGVWRRSQVSIIHSEAELQECVDSHFELGTQPLLLQRFIPGHGAGIFALYDHGSSVGFFAHRRVREKPPSGGVSVVSESVPPDEILLRNTERLLDTAGWHGAAMVEYRTAPDGTSYLMEVNGRLWGSLQLAVSAGFDFPYMLYQIASHSRCEISTAKIGVRNRWLLGDVDHLLLSCRDLHRSGDSKNSYSKLFKDFFNLERRSQKFEVIRSRDLRPFVLEFSRYVRDLFRPKRV